jgi:hypothetical protein
LCKKILENNLPLPCLCGLPQKARYQKHSAPSGSLNFSQGLQETHSLALVPFGHTCFLDKRRHFLGCLKIPSNHWAYIFGVKRKEAHMSQVKKETLKKNEKFEDGVLRADAESGVFFGKGTPCFWHAELS